MVVFRQVLHGGVSLVSGGELKHLAVWLCPVYSVLFSCVVSSSTWLWEGRRVKRHHQCPQPSPRQLLIDGSPVHAILPIAADHCIEGIESTYMKNILRTKLVKHHRQSPQPSPMLFIADISEGDDWICMGEFIGITCNVLSDGLLGSFSNAYLGENLSFYGNQPDCRIPEVLSIKGLRVLSIEGGNGRSPSIK